MEETSRASIEQAKGAALRVLLHNARGPFQGLPRTAGWGYPEPYTRNIHVEKAVPPQPVTQGIRNSAL
jgi:hypothetical protein